jgi:hypothetical protein
VKSGTDESGSWIVDNGNVASMLWRVSDVDAMVASFLPFWVWIAVCECGFKNKARGSKYMEVLRHDWAVGHCISFLRGFVSGIGGKMRLRQCIVEQHSKFIGKTPEFACDNIRPTGHCMKEHDPSLCHGNANVAPCLCILPVSANPTKTMGLAFNANMCGKQFGLINTIVALIMTDMNVMVVRDFLKSFFGFNGLDSISRFFQQVTG